MCDGKFCIFLFLTSALKALKKRWEEENSTLFCEVDVIDGEFMNLLKCGFANDLLKD